MLQDQSTIKAYRVISVLLMSIVSMQANAQWQLDNAASKLSFVSIKAGNIAEAHTFKSMTGSVSAAGEVTLTIDPTSVDTLIPIRDERMQKFLFESDVFPKISLQAVVPAELLTELQNGAPIKHALSAKLSVKDRSIDVSTDVLVVQTKQAVIVTSLTPILLNAASLGLDSGVEKLREIAGLPSISMAVPVSFSLVFEGS